MLTLHQSNHLEYLVDRLADLLGRPLHDPLQSEWVVVQHPGMARWLSLQLASRLGIAANLEFPLPAVFVWRAFHTLLEDLPELDRYQPNRLAWRIHALLQTVGRTDPTSPLAEYLADGNELRCFQLAQELAEHYDRYLLYRPDWILAWERGESALPNDAWQADLWRRLAESDPIHWVTLQQQFFQQSLQANLDGLPQQVCLFGVPTLSPGYLQVVSRLAEVMDVHLFLLNPCATHWADIVPPEALSRQQLQSSAEALYLEVGHPLLATLGRQGRDFYAAINELDPGSDECFEAAGGTSLLSRLQDQILELETPQGGQRADDSIALHVCHSPMREIEVLYDQLLDLFETMPGLSPNEIVVMSPEIGRYAPLIEALFSEPGDRPPIPYRVSDRSLLQSNPLVTAFLQLLELPGSRYPIGQLLTLLEQPAIQHRFGLDEEAVESLTRWLIAAGVRWGRDGVSKTAWDLPPDEANTWQSGLQRLLLGYAMPKASDELWRGVLPLDAAEGAEAERLGGLLDFCERLFALESELSQSREMGGWRDLLLDLLERFFHPHDQSEEQLDELRQAIQGMADEAQEAGFEEQLSLELIRYRLNSLLEASDTRGFLGGGVTFCALSPMRSLPFRVICLIGMNDDLFPRRQPALGFDLMSGQFRFGDRSRRADDRYLFLETLISARERLYISYVGQHQRDNSPLPASVVVDELCDTLRAMTGEDDLQGIVHQHPLQPFSPAYFERNDRLFTYSAARREAAMRVGLGRGREGPLVQRPLPDMASALRPEIPLQRLIEFFINPPRLFARERLALSLGALAELPEEREPFVLDQFQRLDQEREMVEALLQDTPSEILWSRLRASGFMPLGQAGRLEFQQMLVRAEAMASQLRPRLLGGEPESFDVNLLLAQGRLSGRLHNLLPDGQLAYTTGSFHPYQLLRHWLEHLTLNLARPSGIGRETHLLQGDRQGRFHPTEDADGLMTSLMALYREGQERPLPFYPGTAWEYMQGLSKGGEERAMESAGKRWYGNRHRPGDSTKPYNQLLWPDGDCFNEEFGRLAETVFAPLIEHLEWF
jgi:exodeoxyribonuclease V gamma subunit